MKKTIIKWSAVVLAIAALVGIVIFVMDYLSWKNVQFNLSDRTDSITVYSANETDDDSDSAPVAAGSLDKSGTLRLKTGSYYVAPEGNDISSDSINIEITNDTTEIKVNPYYSEDYLAKHFSNEIPDAHQTIAEKYPKIISDYQIEDGAFYQFGDWYGTSLSLKNPDRGESPDTYGVILHKTDGEWQVAAAPNLVFKYDDNPKIPRGVVDAVNRVVNDF